MMTLTSLTHTLWVLCVILTTVTSEDILCPKGSRIHLGSWRCYWLTEVASSWAEAQDSCRQMRGSDLASAESLELQHFIHSSFPVKTTMWVWVKQSNGSEQAVDTDPVGPSRWSRGNKSHGGCLQMALGTPGQWRKASCSGRHIFLCENTVIEFLPSRDIYLTGMVLLTGVYTETQLKLLPKVPDIGHQMVEIQLFPGMWFSHAGQLVSVQLVIQPSSMSSTGRVHILRPYCSPSQHLVTPGCSSVLNPFSYCSSLPLCNTTGGCSLGQYWCHLSESCLYTRNPCSPYNAVTGTRGYDLPPRYPAIPPFYHMAADMPLRMNPSSEHQTFELILPDEPIMVYPDDIVAIQHNRNSGTFLHCLSNEASMDSPWRQSYMTFRGSEWGGWWDGSSPLLPQAGQWVDGVLCDLKILYVDHLQSEAEHNDHVLYNLGGTTTVPDIRASPTDLRARFGLTIIHPVPNENNQICVKTNVPVRIIVKVLSGQRARSSWSTPVHQTGVPFLPSCPAEMLSSCPGCATRSPDDWFSSVTLVLPSVGVQMMNISVTDAVRSQNVSVEVRGYEAITGLTIESHGCPRMLIDTPQSFTAKIKRGSSVKFTWVIDDLEKFVHVGEAYSVVFKKPSEYKLKVTASNPVSSQSEQILLRADDMSPMADPEFLLVQKVVAVNVTNLYTIRVKVDSSLPVTFIWDFGDGLSNVIHTKPALCQAENLLESREKQVYIQDSLNFTYSEPGDYTLHVRVSKHHDNRDAFLTVRARLPLNHLHISASPPIPLVKQSLFLDVSTYPTSYDVNYTWDFGDGSGILQDTQQRVSHAFQFAGFYNITVYANNMLTVLTTWHIVEVSEKISGLAVSNSGPTELNSATHFTGTVTTGASLTWTFDFGDGTLKENHTESSASYLYKSEGVYTVKVTVWNSVSQAHQSITTEVYQLAVSGILPTECVPNGRDAQLTALVNGNISTLTFHWLFGDGSYVAVVKGRSVVAHTFQTPGTVDINLTVFSNATLTLFNSTLCVEATIDYITMLSSQEVVAVGAEVCFQVLVFPEQMAGYQLQWLTSPSSLISRAANTQQQCFIFRDEGIEGISVIASNNVSVQTAKCRVTIQKPVEKFSVVHDIQGDTVSMNTAAWFWVVHCDGSNVSVLWDFGDGSPIEQTKNVSHVFTVTGHFAVKATAFNAVSRESQTFDITVLFPVSDLSICINQPYSVVGDETVFTAVSSAVSNTTYFWVIDGVALPIIGTYKLGFTFLNPGVYQVRVIAKSLLSRDEAAISVEVLERIEGLQIKSPTIVSMKYVPTHENLLFVASVSKGSNVTYQWFGTKSKTRQESTADSDFFQMSAETPDQISIHVTASNILGEASSGISLEAVDRIKGALITSQSNMVALGEVVNISVSVAAGSDLKYVWQMKPNNPPVETNVSFLLHTFTNLGHCSVNVLVQNALSQSNASKNFTVQKEVQEVTFEIDGGTHPFYIPTRRAATLHCLNQNGSNLHWSWEIKGAATAYFDKETSIYSFPHAGIYQVSLNVSNRVNWQAVSHNVTVQDPIKELILKVSKSSFCSGEEVTFVAVISSGSNASFVITFRNGDWIQSQTIPGGRFTTSSLPAGTHLIRVKAWNQVSSAEVSSNILILDSIQSLRIVNCCAAALEAEKRIFFKSEIKSSDPVNYTWMFHLDGFEPIRVGGQEVFFTPPGRGSLLIHVSATDGVCSKSINGTVTVQRPVQNISLVCHSKRIFVGHAAIFSVDVFGGENVSFFWDFGDSAYPLATDLDKVSYTYRTPGKYSIMVKALNNISHTSAQLCVEVEILQCSSPQVALVHSLSTIIRSRSNYFEASVVSNCAAYSIRYLWEVLTLSTTYSKLMLSGKKVRLKDLEVTSPVLLIPKHTLSVGQYCLQFTVSVQGTPLLVRQNATITVVNSPLVALIKGGSKRLWPSLTDLTLDGSESRDLDKEPGDEDTLTYDWTFATLSPQSQLIEQNIESKRSRVTVPSTQLQPGTVYTFTLTVHKIGRTSTSVNQTVIVCEGPVTPVTVRCVTCSVPSSSYQLVSNTLPVVFLGHCEQCDGQAEYMWSAKDQAGLALDLKDIVSPAEKTSPSLKLRPGVLQSGQSYTFTVNVSLPDRGRWGSASIVLQTNALPRGGLCVLSPESDILLLETVVTYDCSGWQQNESRFSQLIYTFQVEACHPNGTTCPLLTLYKGTRSSFGSLLPIGRLGQERSMSVVTAMLLIDDHLGTRVLALKKMLTVKSPVSDDAASQWLTEKSQTEFHTLVQHGNSQEIIPYAIALTSHLNQLGREITAKELIDRREIRKNVTQALVSLPVSSVLDIDQMISALLQSTAVPSELSCGDCQKKLLETVGKVIRVIEEQASLGMSSAVKTGSDILNIIGNTLAAASKPGSGSYSSSSSTPEPASSVTLSALDLAGTLMRSVMHLHGTEQAPVSLSTPYINAVGFNGDTAHLLCTQNSYLQSSKASFPCHFYIPSSFTAHLRSQKSEVVQILLGIDSELTSNPSVSAADPPISTTLIAMELSTPQGKSIAVQHLDPKQAIRVTLSNKHPIKQGCTGSTERKEGEADNTACLAVSLPTEGSLNFAIEAVNRLIENAGLYVSFNFSLDTEYADPEVSTFGLGHIKIEVSSAVPGLNASRDCLVRERNLSLTDPSKSAVESIFLSPLWNGTRRPLFVNMTSALVNSGRIHVSVCVFSSLCQYYSQTEGRWRSEGLQPLEGSTLREAHCLTKHLTVFGASLFVHPGAIVLLPPVYPCTILGNSSGPVRNVIVTIACAVLVLIHLVVGIIAHKMDYLDKLRLRQVPLCGPPGLYQYRVLVKTGWRRGAGTTAHVGIRLYGVNKSGSHHLQKDGAFQRGNLDQFHLETDLNLGEIWKIRIWHDNTGLDPSWYIQHVVVWDLQSEHMFFFLLEDWLSVENDKNSTVEKDVLASCPDELSEFRRVFTSQLVFGVFEHHLWVSLWEHPSSSCFTRGQRVMCSALVLHLYFALSVLWYGAVGTKWQGQSVSARVPVSAEMVAMGMIVAVLVFPLQSFLCFLFRKTQSQVTVDTSVAASPVCHSVEMDVHIGTSDLSGSSFLSLPDSSEPVRESHSSLLESKLFNSSILDFWAASGLAPKTDRACWEEGKHTWPSYDSLLDTPPGEEFTNGTPDPKNSKDSSVLGQICQLKRKKVVNQLRLAPPPSNTSTMRTGLKKVSDPNLTTTFTLSEENLMMSIATDNTNSSSDSGRDSPRSLNTRCTSGSSWPEQGELKPLWAADTHTTLGPHSGPSLYELEGLYRCASLMSVDSMASTFLPSISPVSTRSPSTTRIGIARGQPNWLLPSWALRVIYPVVGVLLAACLTLVVFYGSLWPINVVFLWLISTFSAFLTSALLLEPLKVCVHAFICTTIWRPVDPEVEDQLALETTVVRTSGVHGRRVRPPYGYGLLRAKQEARKVQTLRSLMKHCVCKLLFLLLLLMVNYQDRVEQCQAQLLCSAIRRSLYTAPSGMQNLTELIDWSEVKQWIIQTLVPHLHQNPSLGLVGLPRLQYTQIHRPLESVLQGDAVVTRQLTLTELSMSDLSMKLFKTLSMDFTHHHRESGLFMCVSIQLEKAAMQRLDFSLSIHPLLIPSSSGLDLQMTLSVILLLSALLTLFKEMRCISTECVRYFHQCKHWITLIFGLLSLTTAVLQFCFQSHARDCITKIQSHKDNFINFHHAACLAQKRSQSAAILLTLLILKLLGTLRFMRRWTLLGQVLQRSRRKLWALTALLMSLSMVCIHLGIMLFSHSVEGFSTLHQASISLLSLLWNHMTLQKLCRVHQILGPLFGLLMFGGVWFLARLCGAVLISTYRAEKAELYHPTTEAQDYEMLEFFIKRLKLWLGLKKAKEFRHSVKFEGMDIPPSRLSQESHFSTSSSSSFLTSCSSPCTPSSALSVRSEDQSMSESRLNVLPYLDRLLPCVSALLLRFDQVNQVTEDVHSLEMKLKEALAKIRKKFRNNDITEKTGDSLKAKVLGGEEPEHQKIRYRKIGVIHPKTRISLPSSFSFTPSTLYCPTPMSLLTQKCNTFSEPDSIPFQGQASSSNLASEEPRLASGTFDLCPAGSLALPRSPRRRAWHSGSSNSADAPRRSLLSQDGLIAVRKESCPLTSMEPWEEGEERGHTSGVPVKRKAWT